MPAPAKAPNTRDASIDVRLSPKALGRLSGGTVSPIKAWRITISEGRKRPLNKASPRTT